MFPRTNPHNAPIVDYVPDENIRKDLEGLYIRLCILKYFNLKIWTFFQIPSKLVADWLTLIAHKIP